MKKEIEKITIVSGTGGKDFTIGIDNVEEIIDNSIEYENEIYFIYTIYGKNKKEIARIENAPTVVEYK